MEFSDEAPKLIKDFEDPIAGTELSRHVMKHVCPKCDTSLGVDTETWVRSCPNCEYRWQS